MGHVEYYELDLEFLALDPARCQHELAHLMTVVGSRCLLNVHALVMLPYDFYPVAMELDSHQMPNAVDEDIDDVDQKKMYLLDSNYCYKQGN